MNKASITIGMLLVAALAMKATGAEMLFHASFDGTAVALTVSGSAEPLEMEGLEFAEGVDGQAVRFSSDAKSVLSYAESGNVNPARGTVSLWVKNEKAVVTNEYRFLFGNGLPAKRIGSGGLYFWWHGNRLRTDVSDDRDSYVYANASYALDGEWHHLAWTWDGQRMQAYVDGKAHGGIADNFSPMMQAIKGGSIGNYAFSSRIAFDRFFVGCRSGQCQWDGLIDDFRIYSSVLSEPEIRALADAYGRRSDRKTDYGRLVENRGDNRYVGAPVGEPGTIPAEDLELIEEVRLSSAAEVERLRKSGRLNSVGNLSFPNLNGIGYTETSREKGGRLAVRFDMPARQDPFYVLDIDYPDDRTRTADIIVQRLEGAGGEYAMQCGIAAGGEYPNTGKMLTHRTIWWSSPGDVALALMTARQDAPAAVSAVRVYRVKSGRLPQVKANLPDVNDEGWRRTVSLYYEDPAIGYDFGVPGEVSTPESLCETIDRTIATMKFTGENLFAYPGVWYQGMIDERYNPRNHAPDFLSAWYARFDQEDDMSVMPTINVNNMPVPPDLVTLERMTNGSLHSSVIAIHDTGKPNWGGWHGSPPNFNIAHPEVQKWLLGLVDRLIEQGRGHRSFKGIALHVPRHCMLSFGGIESGYNDYCIETFERASGVRVAVDRGDPLRGRAYAEWIRARPEVYAKWIDWRCEVVSEFWGKIAHRLREARGDLKLLVCLFDLSNPNHRDWASAEYVTQVNREMGVDGAKLAAIPNISLSQNTYPADPRWRGEGYFRGNRANWEKMLNYHAQEATYRILDYTAFPWVGQHDRYWESSIGTGKKHWSSGEAGKTLSCEWLKEEIPWRVTTINPSGFHALRHFVVPLRYHDVLGVSKGGFLIGTYGMEPHLAKFARAFRSLPAVKMDECFRSGDVVGRRASFKGRVYGYVVNTECAPARADGAIACEARNLVTGNPVGDTLELGPYELVPYVVDQEK